MVSDPARAVYDPATSLTLTLKISHRFIFVVWLRVVNSPNSCHPLWPFHQGAVIHYGHLTRELPSTTTLVGRCTRRATAATTARSGVGATTAPPPGWAAHTRLTMHLYVQHIVPLVSLVTVHGPVRKPGAYLTYAHTHGSVSLCLSLWLMSICDILSNFCRRVTL